MRRRGGEPCHRGCPQPRCDCATSMQGAPAPRTHQDRKADLGGTSAAISMPPARGLLLVPPRHHIRSMNSAHASQRIHSRQRCRPSPSSNSPQHRPHALPSRAIERRQRCGCAAHHHQGAPAKTKAPRLAVELISPPRRPQTTNIGTMKPAVSRPAASPRRGLRHVRIVTQ